jgi:hydroxymethylpyrimidine/phosphomethylpyrimidine kinase
MSVITALTAQNSVEVRGIFAPRPSSWPGNSKPCWTTSRGRGQDRHALLRPDHRRGGRGAARPQALPPGGGPGVREPDRTRLLREDAVETLRREMLPLADLLTPNRPEAELLSGLPWPGRRTRRRSPAGCWTWERRPCSSRAGTCPRTAPRSWTSSACPAGTPSPCPCPAWTPPQHHGTGCTLSAAIAAGLGTGLGLADAVARARSYLQEPCAPATAWAAEWGRPTTCIPWNGPGGRPEAFGPGH